MSFEKEFPSMNNTEWFEVRPSVITRREDDIFINCLDKQKVREAIMKHCDCSEYHIVDNKSLTCLDMVLEELGL